MKQYYHSSNVWKCWGVDGSFKSQDEGEYKEWDRHLKEQFINRIKDEDKYMMTKIIRELSIIKKTDEVTSEQVVCLAV